MKQGSLTVSMTVFACATWLAGPAGCYDGHKGEGAGATDGDTAASQTGGTGDDTDTGGPTDPPPENAQLIPESMARRMTQAELDNTLRDLLGDVDEPASEFLNESEFNPFDNDYAYQTPSTAYVESMEVLAQDVAERFVADPARVAQFVPCEPSGADDADCFRQFVESFGRLAFRRPLTDEEVEAYMGLQSYSTEVNEHVQTGFYTGAALVVQAVLQDPEFLYRIEVGEETTEPGVFKLDDFEIASRLSYLLWGTTPDDALIADAEAGMLEDAASRQATIDRMLADPKAREQMRRYHAMWLGYRGIPHTAELVSAFNDETAALIDRVIFDDQLAYSELFTLDETYVDDFLAGHYGLPSPGANADWVSYDGTGRAGILGHGSVLAGFSKFTDTSPTQRGIFIRERLMCMAVPPPPPEVDPDAPPGDPDDPTLCKEDRYAAHSEVASCAACHDLFDPIGMGLENYDIAGVYRTSDDGKPECTISGDGQVPNVGPFNGPGELADRLVESGTLEACALRHYMSFAYGRELHAQEQDQLDHRLTRFEELGWDFAGFMTDYAGDDLFGFRREPSE